MGWGLDGEGKGSGDSGLDTALCHLLCVLPWADLGQTSPNWDTALAPRKRNTTTVHVDA